MNKTEFKKIVGNKLKENGFSFEQKAYYLRTDTIIICVEFQKSNYGNTYFINYGFLLVKLNPTIKHPKTNTSDVFGRFTFYDKGVLNKEYQIDFLEKKEVIECIQINIGNNIKPVLEKGLATYLETTKPSNLFVKLVARQYLGIE
ncbi:DUF4304 domain-containing protein [Listeria swaminathanii]|uniref:DUF4304 domain-containing protein n=1 Tax=Listeria swaminathanii TaxID=2713501 RepID=A0ABU2II90_9LIST|nr:DUF4304 domain-containing protein [Listeria swaminathanii]MDT0018193.1 DUF4304 domain-containing protein [Listeria swaminathanii]MDT0023710.1 DUF4304 domain-containing protein [Listeria swaminathanii]MDT0034651.1 DUF4304 domain-containing protein [Listeria swaminathanii]MDT0053415.1 DUF4304 domain-containing protein [Listeria swaminathanii]MDT0056240.1 DUF4304 domain-containing protein [Listeria swaminathanii]